MKAVFLQVRLDSSRLPAKALLNLADRTVVEHAMRALDQVKAEIRCLLTTKDSVNTLLPYARQAGWEIFAGSKDDVLARFIHARRKYDVDCIIRATGDNPLVSVLMAEKAIELAEKSGADYAGFRDIPVGSGVEIINANALETAFIEAQDPYEREHVAPFLYRRPERFLIEIPSAPGPFQSAKMRITLDTQDDYIFLQRLYAELYQGEPLDLDRIIPWWKEYHRNAG